jgi:hypothetical protein
MLIRYLQSPECQFFVPAEIEAYVKCNDYALYEHLAGVANKWAERIAQRKPFRVLLELHEVSETARPRQIYEALEREGIEAILASSQARLSRYHAMAEDEKHPIFVVDQYDPMASPVPIEECTEIFKKYEETRRIERLYVAEENYAIGRRLLVERRL